MIKFIASDLDGTLLQNGAQSLEPRVFDLIRQLQSRGIVFAAASGRQYLNLRHLFAPVRRDMMFIAENGALIMHRDQTMHKVAIPHALGVALMQDILARQGCDVLLCGQYTSYAMPGHQAFLDHLLYTIRNTLTVVDDILQVQEDFIKISAYMHAGVTDEVAASLHERWAPYFSVAVSGREWVDFTLGNKGAAIRMIQDQLGLSRDEMMAFGDNFNDEHMLRMVGHGYAMENAHQAVRAMCANSCSRVEDVLEELLRAQPQHI